MASKIEELYIRILPEKPGVYQYFDASGKIIYVGKAKNLKKRVASYFRKDQSPKVAALVRKIEDIKYIVVDSEVDALLLENNLIKEYKPHYNILLKDDKTYPWICISREEFPRIFSSRKLLDKKADYYGPYPSVRTMNTLLNLIFDLYSIRNCKFRLSEENIASKKIKPCLQYHIKQCKGPCQGWQTQEEYLKQIKEIKQLIRGHIAPVMHSLKEKMHTYAQERKFKQAQECKEQIEALQTYQSKSTVVSSSIKDVDVFGLKEEENEFIIHYMKLIDGRIIQSYTTEIKKKLDESAAEILDIAIPKIREIFDSQAPEIILETEPETRFPNLQYTIPKIGDKKKLLDLSMQNIRFYLLERSKKLSLIDPERHNKRILEQARKDLGMSVVPLHIECFDNSNFHGDYAVAAMTVFKNAKASKKDYRHYIIRSVTGPNDYASMEEVIYRRYKRLLDEKGSLPQLIVVDGGKGQISSAYKSLQSLGIENQVFLIGIAEKLEEIYKYADPYPLLLDKKSDSLKLIQQIRDEAHRFGISHYRKRHEKGLIKTELTEIKGIGKETAFALLRHFKSVNAVKQSSLEEIAHCIGPAKAKIVWQYFQNKNHAKDA